MAWECIISGKEIEDVKADKKSAKGVEKYMISARALYFDGKYLPLKSVESVSIHDSVYNPHCCCGRGIPVKKLKIEYGAEKPLILMVEKDSNAKKLAELIGKTADADGIGKGAEGETV